MAQAKQGDTVRVHSTVSFRRVVVRKSFLSIAAAMCSVLILLSCVTTGPEDIAIKPAIGPKGLTSDGNIQFIDTHNHLVGRYGSHSGVHEIDYEGAATVALATMSKLGIRKMLIMPPPFPPDLTNRPLQIIPCFFSSPT